MSNHQEFQRILNFARVDLPGASDAGMKAVLYEVLQEMFTETNAWQEDISLPIVAAQTAYTLVPDPPGQIVRLLGVVDSNTLPQPAIMRNIPILTLRDIPNQAQTFTASVAMTPSLPVASDGLPEIPDWFLPIWSTTVSSGLLAKMMVQPRKTYSDAPTGRYHLGRYRDGLNRLRIAVLRRNTFGVNSWVYPQTFRTRTQRGGVSVGNAVEF